MEDSLVDEYRKITGGVQSHDVVKQGASEIARMIGTEDAAMQHLADQGKLSDKLAMEALASRQIHLRHVTDMIESAKFADRGGNYEQVFNEKFDRALESAIYRKQTATNIGRALSSYNIVANPAEAGVGEALAKLAHEQIVEGQAGPVERAQFRRALQAMTDDNQFTQLLKDGEKKWSGKIDKALSIHNEYWINSLLSGPRTQVTNVISQAGMTLLQPAFRSIGGAFSLDGAAVKSGFRVYANLVHSLFDSFQLGANGLRINPEGSMAKAAKAFWGEQPILDSMTKVEGPRHAISAENLGIKPGTWTATP
jgi:hypothetical protein